MAESAKVKRFREKNERELWSLITNAGYVAQCLNAGDPEGVDTEMGIFAERVLKLIEKESRRKIPPALTQASENITQMVKKA